MKLNVQKKLLLSFSTVLILLTLLSGNTYFQLKTINTDYSNAIEERLNKISLASSMMEDVYKEQASIRGYLVTGSENQTNNYVETSLSFNKSSNKLLNLSTAGSTGYQLTQKIIDLESQYRDVADQLIVLKKQNREEAYIKLMNDKAAPIVTALRKTSTNLNNYQQNSLLEKRDLLSDQTTDTLLFIVVISIIAIITGLVIALLISRNLSKPVQLVSETVEEIAKGNLLVNKIEVKNKDEIGQLAASFNQMAENLQNVVQQVSQTSGQVAASAEELTASAEQTSSATSQVANSIEDVANSAETLTAHAHETAETVNEMAAGIQKVADKTSTVAESALDTTKQANKGNDYILKVIEQMKSIHSSSNKTNDVIKELNNRSSQIGQIIEVITGIAEQTNLLALNAAIESARAGEHGRGFAVVADEVKKLAEQSRESANQIAELIQAIQKDTYQVVEMMNNGITEVTEGMQLVHETGTTFNTILKSIENVNSEIQEVSAISVEMSASVEEVNASVSEIAEIVKGTASNTAEIASASEEQLATMEEVSSAAVELAKMSENLSDIVKQFKI